MNKKSSIWKLVSKYYQYILLLIMILVSALMSDKFFTGINISNLLKQNSAIGIVAIGELVVILTGGIDLSVGAIVSMSTVVVSLMLKSGSSISVSIIVTLLIGILAGIINGTLITKLRIIPFIATLATQNIFSGIGLLLSTGRQVFYDNDNFLLIGSMEFNHIPLIAIVWLIIALIVSYILEHTRTGRYIKGFGGNKESVRLSGVNIQKTEMTAYIISGLLCAIGGVIMASRLTLGSNSVGTGWELTGIAGTVIGGGSMTGGVGTVGGVIVGTLVMGLIGNIMNLMKVSIYWQQIVKGSIILIAVYSSLIRNKEVSK